MAKFILMLASFFCGPGFAQVPTVFGRMAPYDQPIVEVQQAPLMATSGTTSLSTTFSSMPETGSTILVFINGWRSAAYDYPAGSVTDNNGNTYTSACKIAGTSGSGYVISTIFYAKNISISAGTFQVTATPSLSSEIMLRAIEYKGMDHNSPLDVTSSNSGASTTQSSGTTAATNYEDELVAAVLGLETWTTALTNTAGFTDNGTVTGGVNPIGQFATKKVTAKSTQVSTWSTGATYRDYKACIATFR